MRRAPDPEAAVPDAGRLQLTGEGLAWLGAAALLGAVGWFKSINLVLLLAYLMAALLLLNGVLARRQARRVAVTREPAPPSHAGEEAAVRLSATNTGAGPATVSVEDRTGEAAAGWLVHALPPGATVACAARRVFPARGRFAAAVRVSSAFPLGLVRHDRPAGPGAELVVLPAAGAADPTGLRHWVLRHAGGDGRTRRVLRRVTTDQADVRGVRPYRPGDPMRAVHWRSSARRGELMVREYDAAPAPDLVLVVEPWLPADPSAVQIGNLEAALSLAVTVARTWTRTSGTRVTVAVAGDPESVRTTLATDSGVREALAPLAGVAGAARFDVLPPGVFDRSSIRGARLVVSSRRSSPYAAALTRATGRPFVTLSPADHPPWYQPPGVQIAEDRGQRSETRSE